MRRALATALVVAAATAPTSSGGSYEPPPGDHRPVWSPDGTAIVYLTRREPRGLHVMSPDGSGDRLLPLPSPDSFGPASYVFSPDWFWIAFASNELVVSRPDGSGRRRLSETSFGVAPAWSPDGRRLAFPRSDGLYVVAADGSGLRRLTPAPGWSPAWSPDGELIAFVGGPFDATQIRAVRPDGSGERVLSERVPGGHQGPVWSPDGQSLAFLTNLEDRSWRVTITTRDGEPVAQFPPTYSLPSLAWSPDSRRLLMSSLGVSVFDLEIRRLDIVVPFGSAAVWSPSGSEMAFEGGGECKDRIGIYRAAADGTGRVRLTNDCRIFGTPRPDRLTGTDHADILLGLGGDDRILANGAAYVGDDLYGGPGNDVLTGDGRAEVLDGGPGRDTLGGLAGPDFLRGGTGSDVLRGHGGRDQIRAEDGVRDDVFCGTNRLRGTGAELDTAYVDRVDRLHGGCELVYRNGRANLRAGRTSLSIVVNPGGATGRNALRTLRCRPAGGTLPRAAAACRRLAAMHGPLAPVPYDRLCAPLDARSGATVRGVFAGQRIAARFARSNTCEAERWDRHRFLFPPR